MIRQPMSTLVSTDAFTLTESVDQDGVARLAMVGELDIAVADQVRAGLADRLHYGVRIRLDLSRLAFIDSSGLRTLVVAVTAGRAAGEHLVEVDRNLRSQVRRVIELAGVGTMLWPEDLRGAADAARPEMPAGPDGNP